MSRDHPRIMVKKLSESSRLLSTVDVLSNRQTRSCSILVTLFISLEIKSYTMLCCTCRQYKRHHTAKNIVTRSLNK